MTIPVRSRARDLAYGIATLLGTSNVGLTFRDDQHAFSASQQYDPTELGIWIGSLPNDPAQAVAVTPYPLTMHPVFTDDTMGVQILVRGGADRSRTWAIQNVIRTALRGRFPIRLTTGLHVSSLEYGSGTSLGRDNDKRWTESDNWTARLGASHPVT